MIKIIKINFIRYYNSVYLYYNYGAAIPIWYNKNESSVKLRIMKYLDKNTAIALKSARKTAGFTQKQVAEKMGIYWRHLQRIESGGQNLTLETIERYFDAIGVKVELILKK